MKTLQRLILVITTLSLLLVLTNCSDDKDDNKDEYGSTKTFVSINIDNKEVWYKDNNFSTIYIKIPSDNSPAWFDVVCSDKSIDTITPHYLYIHATNPLAKSFTYDDSVHLDEGFSVIYYENKTEMDNLPMFEKYMTNADGFVSIAKNDGVHMSGMYMGNMYDEISSQTHYVKIIFNYFPISLVK